MKFFKPNKIILNAIWLLLCICYLYSCNSNSTNNSKNNHNNMDTYYCPMHPMVKQNVPGVCPEPSCHGMKLVKKIKEDELNNTLKSVNSNTLSNVKTIKPIYQTYPISISVNGYVDYDDRTRNNISARISGRIEKLFVKYNYQPIKKGQKVFEIYSPELVTAQENLIFILENDPNEKELIDAAKEKLILLGFKDELLSELVRTKKLLRTVPVFSKYDGHIHDMSGGPPMNAMAPTTNSNTKTLLLREGAYVMVGETVFNIIGSHNVSINLQIKASEIASVEKGMQVEIENDNKQISTGIINFIEPTLKPNSKTVIAKSFIKNENHLFKIGTLVKATIKGEGYETLWIPLTSVIDLGIEKIVWIKNDGIFTAKLVAIGLKSGKMVEVIDGLTENDEIAIEAHYFSDSESFIKTNKQIGK